MPDDQSGLWSAGDAYELYMGRWSRKVAPLFTDWLDTADGGRWIDIGCGTGVLTSTVLERCDPSEVVGIDSAPAFLEIARARSSDPRVSFKQGDAQALAEEDGGFDVAVSGLVLNFVPDKQAMAREMRRAVRPGGMAALYIWDYAGHMQIMRTFFDVATAFDPTASQFDDGVKAPVCRPRPLAELFEQTGFTDVDVTALDIPAGFANFDDYWAPFLGGTGSAPKYCASLDEARRERLREAIRDRLPTGPDGEILMAVRAWAAKGRVVAA